MAHAAARWAVLMINVRLLLILMLLACNLFFTVSASAQNFVKGIDVSLFQGTIDWSQVRQAGYEFAFIKATDGVSVIDPFFERNMDGARAAGLLIGNYHFARPNRNSAIDEARHFVSTIRAYLEYGYLRPALDIEDGNSNGGAFGMSVAELSNWIHEWMTIVIAETGIKPLLYAPSSYAEERLDPSLTKYDLWIAHWTYNPAGTPRLGKWNNWIFWQYSDMGSVPGITQNVVDLDVFNGTKDQLQFLCHTFTLGSTITQGFGVPWNFFTTPANELVLQAFCSAAGVTAQIHKPSSIQYHYTYNQGHQWNATLSRWEPFTYTCSQPLLGNVWCPASASANLNLANPFFIAYACSYVNNQWKCGCRDAACSQSFWQLQQFQP